MTAKQRPDLASGTPAGNRARKLSKLVAVALGGTVLIVFNLLTAYFAIIAWVVTPDAAYDRDRLAAAGQTPVLTRTRC